MHGRPAWAAPMFLFFRGACDSRVRPRNRSPWRTARSTRRKPSELTGAATFVLRRHATSTCNQRKHAMKNRLTYLAVTCMLMTTGIAMAAGKTPDADGVRDAEN